MNWLFRYVLLPVFEGGFKGRSIFRYWRELEESQWLSRPDLEQRQLASLRQLLIHAFRHCPYYRDCWRELGLDAANVNSLADFRRWPIIDRDAIRQHRLAMRAQIPGMRLLTKSTGGSSGNPLVLDLDYPSHDRRTAGAYRGYHWAGAYPGSRQLHLWGVPLGQRSRLHRWKDYLFHRMHNRLILNSFELGEASRASFLDQWNRYQPDHVVAYTSALYSLARMVAQRGFKAKAPKSIIVGAEKLYLFQRELIEEVFQAPVFESYGCREVMLIGAECDRHEGLHVTMENLVVEILGDDGNPAPPGEAGNVVLTDLFNYGMPFIRYANGDRAVASREMCPCGRGLPLLHGVVGRRLDVLVTPDDRRVPGEFFPHFMKDFPSVHRFQVVQEAIDRIELRVVLDAPLRDDEQGLLHSEVRQVLGPRVQFDLRVVDSIPLTAAGKQQVVVNRLMKPRQEEAQELADPAPITSAFPDPATRV
jgi:phenylacetate-CoA ligase